MINVTLSLKFYLYVMNIFVDSLQRNDFATTKQIFINCKWEPRRSRQFSYKKTHHDRFIGLGAIIPQRDKYTKTSNLYTPFCAGD